MKTDDKSISWSVDNRYYSADISLLINTSDEGNDCEAIVFLYATHEVSYYRNPSHMTSNHIIVNKKNYSRKVL